MDGALRAGILSLPYGVLAVAKAFMMTTPEVWSVQLINPPIEPRPLSEPHGLFDSRKARRSHLCDQR